jgi:hypothetical protein
VKTKTPVLGDPRSNPSEPVVVESFGDVSSPEKIEQLLRIADHPGVAGLEAVNLSQNKPPVFAVI